MIRVALFAAAFACCSIARGASPTMSPSVHDPSKLVRCGDAYYCFATGNGLRSWRSTDLRTWTEGPPVFATPLPWLADVVPGQRGSLWAPDVVRLDDADGERYLLYYSISTFGHRTSAIALATNRTLDPADPRYAWIDRGTVVRTGDRDDFNAIDPSVFHDRDGRLWLTFGSFWSGIRLIELDATTGLRRDDKPSVRLAWKNEIEASFLTSHDGKYFLFVNWGKCCLGVRSTYEIRVGRSDRVTGPYVDRDGVALVDGGGTSVLAGDGAAFVGPGHAGIVVDADGHAWLTGHFYDATDNGRSHLFLRALTWDASGWPVVGAAR